MESSQTVEHASIQKVMNEKLCEGNVRRDENIKVAAVKNDAQSNLDEETPASLTAQDVIEIRVWRNNKIRICKPLIPLRLAQCLWFGGGRIKSYFFAVIMKQRGLTVVEFSTVFSLIFLFQLAVSSLSGIVADKIGNAKPVLMFHMLASLILIIGILLAPNISDNSCLLRDGNQTCSDVVGNKANLEYCNYTCFENCTKKFLIADFDGEENAGNDSFLSNSILLLDSNETNMKISISLKETDTSLDDRYSTSYLDYSQYKCSTKTRTEFRVLYAILIVSFFVFWSTTYRFLDFTALCLVKRNDSHFGKERSFAIAGEILMATLAIFVLNAKTSSYTKNDYDSMYWITAAVTFLALISVYNIKAVTLPPGRKLVKKTFKLMSDIDVVVFIAVVFAAGNAFSFTFNYHSWFLDSLNASKAIIGFNLMTFPLYGLPVLLTSDWWIKKFGTTKIIIIGLLAYTIQGISYSFLYYPWLSVIIQSTIAFSYYLLWVATIVHCDRIAPEGFAATLNAVAGTVHYGIGRSTGVSIGGLSMNYFGIRVTYRILAFFCAVTAVLYSIFLYMRHLSSTKNSGVHGKDLEEMKSMSSKDVEEV